MRDSLFHENLASLARPYFSFLPSPFRARMRVHEIRSVHETSVAAGVTCCSPEKNHPWWSHPSGVHLGTRFLESARLVRVPYGTVSDGNSSESLLTPLSAMEISPRACLHDGRTPCLPVV